MGSRSFFVQVGDGFERDVRIDRAGAVADQQAEMMGLARLAGFDDQPALHARAFADQVMMHRRSREQRRDRRMIRDRRLDHSTRIDAPSFTALRGVGHQLFERGLSPSSPSETLKSIGSVTARRSPTATWRGVFPDRRWKESAA